MPRLSTKTTSLFFLDIVSFKSSLRIFHPFNFLNGSDSKSRKIRLPLNETIKIKKLLSQLEKNSISLKLLGSYPKAI